MSEHFDVVIIGAGISGIGAGYHLQHECPDRSYVILDGRSDMGGTWDLFRYPGIRSDSDMHTLGYSFKPWTDAKAIADGPSILEYLRETAEENGIDHHMRFNHLVTTADWSSDDATWSLTVDHNGDALTYTCNFLFMCAGYYSYKGGYTPEFEGRERFGGEIVHPQQWPEDLDFEDKRVIVVGSGATAMTLIPAMADKTAHITMLQRSPTYVVARPAEDKLANALRKVLPDNIAHRITRRKNLTLGQLFYSKTRKDPDKVKQVLLKMTRKALGDEMVEQHFTPSYNPWDQRLCLIPDGDLYEAINSGKASVVTDTIDTFTEKGILLDSGDELEADIIITATGLQLVTLGEMNVTVDGETIDFSQVFTYKGLAYSGVPNLVSSFGYINASWTLRSDLTCDFVCRLLNHMRTTGTDRCTPTLAPKDHNMPQSDWIKDFSSGYMQRMMPMLPKQGDHEPWVSYQNYYRDVKMVSKSPIDDGVMKFSQAPG